MRVPGGGDLVEAQLAGRAVDERRAEEQRRRADRADHEVLEPRLERADQVDVDRAQHVERDREPLEAEEERHQVRGLDEERHAGAGRREQDVVLGDVLLAHRLAVGDEHGDERRRPATMICAVADQRSRKIESATIAAPCGLFSSTRIAKHERGDEAGAADDGGGRAPARLGQKTATIISRPAAASIESDGESANQSTCGLWITAATARVVVGLPVPNEWPLIASGQAESTSRIATSGTTTASSPARRSSAASVTAGPTSRWSTAEISAQHVHRGEHDRDRADHRPAPALLEDAGEDQELAGEVRRQRHGERHHADRHQHASRARAARAPCRRAARARRSRCAARPSPRAGTSSSRAARG